MARQSLSKSFGEIVRTRRTALKLTQEKLAEQAGVHPTYIGMVERGERNSSIDVAAAIADALGQPLSKLISEAEGTRQKGSSQQAERRKGHG